jgi:hypothetical protein
MLVLAMQFSRSADAGACGAESEDEDAGAATGASPAEPRDEGGSLPQNRREERSSGPGSAVGRKHLLTDDVAVDRTERGSNWESSLRVQEP